MLPILFQHEPIIIFSYPLFWGLAWGIAYQYSRTLIEERGLDLKHHRLFFVFNFIAAWVGAKLLFLVVSAGASGVEKLGQNSFWLGGGFVFYGGLIGSILFSLLFCRFCAKFTLLAASLHLPALLLAHGVGRVGCFLAGCCFGKETSFITGVHLHSQVRHPVQLYESAGLFMLFFLYRYLDRNRKWGTLQIISYYFAGYGSLRFILEFFRGDEIRGVHGLLSTGQILSLVFVVLAAAFLFWVKRTQTLDQSRV